MMNNVFSLSDDEVRALDLYWRAANYLGAAQIYLRDNCLLTDRLRAEHIKPRLLGHWGTIPGINFVSSVAKNGRFIAKTDRLPRPSHTGSLLWPNPIHSNGVIIRAKSSFSAYAGICVMLSAIVTSKK